MKYADNKVLSFSTICNEEKVDNELENFSALIAVLRL